MRPKVVERVYAHLGARSVFIMMAIHEGETFTVITNRPIPSSYRQHVEYWIEQRIDEGPGLSFYYIGAGPFDGVIRHLPGEVLPAVAERALYCLDGIWLRWARRITHLGRAAEERTILGDKRRSSWMKPGEDE